MSQFKKGDRVRCIQPISDVACRYNLEKNKVYIVEHVNETSVKLKGCSASGYTTSRFELVKESQPFERGDIVACIRGRGSSSIYSLRTDIYYEVENYIDEHNMKLRGFNEIYLPQRFKLVHKPERREKLEEHLDKIHKASKFLKQVADCDSYGEDSPPVIAEKALNELKLVDIWV